MSGRREVQNHGRGTDPHSTAIDNHGGADRGEDHGGANGGRNHVEASGGGADGETSEVDDHGGAGGMEIHGRTQETAEARELEYRGGAEGNGD